MQKNYLAISFIFLCLLGARTMDLSAQIQNRIEMRDVMPETKITYADGRLIVENLPQDALLEVYSIVGVKVYSRRIQSGTNEYYLNLSKGYYIIRVGEIVKKIAVR